MPTPPGIPDAEHRCRRIMRSGEQCKAWALSGGDLCNVHSNFQNRRRVLVRQELMNWELDPTEYPEPGEVLLKLMAQAEQRAALYSELLRYSLEIATIISEDEPIEIPPAMMALTGLPWTDEVDKITAAAAIALFAPIEREERKLAMDFASKAVAHGLAERQVRIAEAQSTVIIGAVFAALDAGEIGGELRFKMLDAAADFLLQQGAAKTALRDPVTTVTKDLVAIELPGYTGDVA